MPLRGPFGAGVPSDFGLAPRAGDTKIYPTWVAQAQSAGADVILTLDQSGSGAGAFVDSSGNGHHLTPNTTIVNGTNMLGANQALADSVFDFSTGLAQATSAYDVTQALMSMGIWVKPLSLTASGSQLYNIVMSCATAGNTRGWDIGYRTNGTWTLIFAGVAVYEFATTQIATVGTRTHLMVVLRPGNIADLYLDGYRKLRISTGSMLLGSGTTLTINSYPTNGGNYQGKFEAEAAEIYRYSLTDDQVFQSFNAGITPLADVTTNLNIAAPPADATASGLVPAESMAIPAAVADATASAPAPGFTFSEPAPVANANASAPVPAFTEASNVVAPPATSTASAPTPVESMGVPAPVANAAASAPPPGITEASNAASVPATATASCPSPGFTFSVPAVVANATASSPAPVSHAAVPEGTAGLATASMPAPGFTSGNALNISAPPASATADGATPVEHMAVPMGTAALATASVAPPSFTIGGDLSIAAPPASATASMPIITSHSSVTVTFATATASIVVPKFSYGQGFAAALATASIATPSFTKTSTGPNANKPGHLISTTPGHTIRDGPGHLTPTDPGLITV